MALTRARPALGTEQSAWVYALMVFLLLVLPSLGESARAAPPATQQVLTVGIIPAFSTERLVATFEPLVDYLAEASGIPMRMETAPDIEEFAHRTVSERRYDLLLTAPHLYVDAAQRAGYRLLARVDEDAMRVLVVVPRDSAVRSLAELRSKRVASTDPMALTSVQGIAVLKDAGLDPDRDVTLVVTPNMDAGLQALLRDHADAVFLAETFFGERLAPDVRAQLRTVGTSKALPHMPVSAASWVDAAQAERVAGALMQLHESREGTMVLRKLGWRGFVRAQPQDYAAAGGLLKHMRSTAP